MSNSGPPRQPRKCESEIQFHGSEFAALENYPFSIAENICLLKTEN